MRWHKRLGGGDKWRDLLPLAQRLRSVHPEQSQRQLADALRTEVPELPGTDRVVELIRKWEYQGELARSNAARSRFG